MQKSLRHIPRTFNSLCHKRNWFTFREYVSAVCQLVVLTSHMVFQSRFAPKYRCLQAGLHMNQGLNSTAHTSGFNTVRDVSLYLKHTPGTGRCDRDPMGHQYLLTSPVWEGSRGTPSSLGACLSGSAAGSQLHSLEEQWGCRCFLPTQFCFTDNWIIASITCH